MSPFTVNLAENIARLRTALHPVHTLDRPTQESRSLLRSFGRCAVLLYRASCWAQREIFEGEVAVAAAEDREEGKQVEQRGDHGTAVVSGSEHEDQPRVRRMRVWRGTRSKFSVGSQMRLGDPIACVDLRYPRRKTMQFGVRVCRETTPMSRAISWRTRR